MYLILKHKLKGILSFLKHFANLFYYQHFNSLTKLQTKNFKQIPIIIISFNQYFYLKKLIDFLVKNEYSNIIIIDNNSSFEPLLNYFEEIKSIVTIHRLEKNEGHMVFWKNEAIFNKYSKGYYVVTDADIVPTEDCPSDFLLYFKNILDKSHDISKVGFSLKINDIPDSNVNKQKIINWETKFWSTKDDNQNFIAQIDTTFAIYRPKSSHIADDNFYKAIRVKKPYNAIHGGWYIDNENLTIEQTYFYKTANSSSSWKANENGIVEKSLYL